MLNAKKSGYCETCFILSGANSRKYPAMVPLNKESIYPLYPRATDAVPKLNCFNYSANIGEILSTWKGPKGNPETRGGKRERETKHNIISLTDHIF